MTQEYDIKSMATKIKALRRSAEALREISGGIPSVIKNADRILGCVAMLEVGISEALKVAVK
jgi:hypothetical protein